MTDIEINELVLQKIAGWVKYPIKAGWLTKAILAGGDELVNGTIVGDADAVLRAVLSVLTK